MLFLLLSFFIAIVVKVAVVVAGALLVGYINKNETKSYFNFRLNPAYWLKTTQQVVLISVMETNSNVLDHNNA